MPIQVQPGKPGHERDAQLVAAELVNLPASIGSALIEADMTVVACREAVTDFEPDLAGKRPDNWPEGATWDTVPGAYLPARKTVVVATVSDGSGQRRVPRLGERHGSRSLAVHETLHALDFTKRHRLSDSPVFADAWAADHALLRNTYYTDADTGRRETFAESGAHHYGLDPSQRDSWPNLRDYWKAFGVRPLMESMLPLSGVAPVDEPRPRTIGLGIRRPDGRFVLYLTAHDETGASGHGMVIVGPGDPSYDALLGLASSGEAKGFDAAADEPAVFDVPPFAA